MKKKIFNKKLIFTVIGVLSLLFIWEIVALIINSPMILPSPIDALGEFFALLSKGDTYLAFLSTGLRSLIGFLIAFILGAVLGYLSYASDIFERFVSPFIKVLRAVPTMSVILIAVIWFAPSISPVFIGFLIIFPTIYQSVYTALCGVDKDLIEMSKIYNATKKDRIFSLYLPSIRKSVLSMAKSQISLNVKVVIAGEVLAYTAKSIGMQMYITKLDIATATLFGWTIFAVILSSLFELMITIIDHLTDPVKIRDRKIKKATKSPN